MNLVILPILLPFFTAAITAWWTRPGTIRRTFVAISAIAQLGVAIWFISLTCTQGRMVLPVGGWMAPFGITLVADPLASIMLGLSSLTSLAALFFGFFESSPLKEHPLRIPLLQFLVLGINLSFLTGDLFNLFVAFEIMLIASYGLLTLEADNWDVRQAFPYLAINLVGGALFFCAAGMAYAIFGTLNFADIAMRAEHMTDDPRVYALATLLLAVFGLKAGIFPLYFWLPGSYPILPVPIAAFYSGMLTKVGVYVMLRFVGTVLPPDMPVLHLAIAWIAGFTMILGVMGAIAQNTIRGILSYHILSQIGFMVLAIGLFTPLSIAAAIFYIVHHIIVKASLFLVGGVAGYCNKTDHLDRMGNLWRYMPFLGVLFLFQALSLAGIPPLSGFWGKFLIIAVGIAKSEYVLVAASLIASILTLFSMLKIWNGAFWKEGPEPGVFFVPGRTRPMIVVIAAMTAVSITIGFGAEFFFGIARQAAELTLDRSGYAADVFNAIQRPPSLHP